MSEIDSTKYYLINRVEDEDGVEGWELLPGSYLSEDEAESNLTKFQAEGLSPMVQKGIDLENRDLKLRRNK